MSNKTLQLIKDHDAKWVDLRFTDTRGKEQHVSFPAHTVSEETFVQGKMFDGSSLAGWKGIEASDMILMPDDVTAFIDPFFDEPTVVVTCDIIEPSTMQGYERDPRSIAKRAEAFLKASGIADTAYFGPEPEFFVFDEVKFDIDMSGARHTIIAEEAAWSTNKDYEGGNSGHRPRVKGGYFPVPPVDSGQDLRVAMCNAIEAMMGPGRVEVQHHEVASCQSEIGVTFNTLVRKADEVQVLKYAVLNTAHSFGKTATFMPKPIVGDNGSGMHVHQSLSKDGKNLFAGDEYGGLSELAIYYIGGIIKHARSLNAITNPATNSYKRLVPHYEAPIKMAYSARNRSASIRIPYVASPKGRRIETRFPDPVANPYLAFAALMMAGLDGVINKIHPGPAQDKNLYDLPPEEDALIPTVAESLEQALDCLEADHDYLLAGGVFTKDFLDSYIELKREEVRRLNTTTHPIEFEMYYSC
jgi:glutamine synthetase